MFDDGEMNIFLQSFFFECSFRCMNTRIKQEIFFGKKYVIITFQRILKMNKR